MSTQFGKYVLQRKLAEGGMAEVFLARQTGPEFCDGFEKLVVIKRILSHLAADESFLKMFLNEARVAARLNHPNVVQIFDLGKIDDQYFIAMEYVHGEDLRSVILKAAERERRPPLGLACRIVADTLAGLHYAHTRVGPDGKPLGLVHRDVSPQNVIVTYEGSIKLVDFGIAKATREVNAAQTQAGLLKGKYAYMAPEQARGQQVDARSDVFCIGILLWEMVTWQRLFKRGSDMATLMAVAEEPVPAPHTVAPDVLPELDRLIVKALARKPEERFASAQEMRAALEQLIRQRGWEADALALSTWMRDLFADKLRAQAADVAAAGLGSLEDFLLTVEEKTSISWMAPVPGERKTPSTGLPSSRPVAEPRPAAPYDDGTTAGRPELPTMLEVPVFSGPHATTLKNGEARVLSPLAGLVPSGAALTASPTAATMGVVAPPEAPGGGTPSMNLPPERNPFSDRDRSTAKRVVFGGRLPPALKRVLVAGSVAGGIAAITLTIAFWPAHVPEAAGAPAAAHADPTRPSLATLLISVDAPADIAVDGKPQPPGTSATVTVQPGVEHIVTVQRPGHALRKLHVPALAPGERMPLSFSLR